ncbi:MAG: aspartyl protease family protein [Fimbriimonadaceae bacterium]|nr:aspartyl protease family protein [Fimbriimonadaceae bacterium]
MMTAVLSLLLFPIEIQAERVGPYLVAPAVINGSPVRLLLDSGAGMNVLTNASAKRLGIEGGTPVQASGVGDATVTARIVSLTSLAFGNETGKPSSAVVVDLPAILESDGLIGHGVLSSAITTIDYEKATLRFEPIAGWKAPAGFTAIPLRVRSNIPEVPMKIDGVETWCKVDSGASDALTLFSTFVESRGLRTKLKTKPSLGGMGVGGISTGETAEMSGIELAGHKLPSFTVTLSRQQKGAFADKDASGNLGADILRRFTVILDYKGEKAYFRKNAHFEQPFATNRSGAAVLFDGKEHRVRMVSKDSAAFDAGVKIGDRILAVDGKPVEQMKAMDVWAALRQPAGTKVRLTVQSGTDDRRDVELVLR